MKASYRLIVSCPDQVGIVARVTGFIAGHKGTITEANQYADSASGMFFMRYVIDAATFPLDAEGLRGAFEPIAQEFEMDWRVTDTAEPKKVVVMVSKQSHCLADLLYRWKSGDTHFDIPCVISNHEDMRDDVEWHGVSYQHIPVGTNSTDKENAFAETTKILEQHQPDVIVLARYMQILPPALCDMYPNRIINIHHSFLPSFAGARPYHQAQERGVKLTGATCHYVTEALDAGPIIEQDVIRISHHDSVEEIVRLGKDVEKNVLARGLRYHLEDRVLVHGNKTVIFA